MNPGSNRIFVAGHRGMVGAAILRQLMAQGVPAGDIVTRTRAELDLTDQAAVRGFLAEAQIVATDLGYVLGEIPILPSSEAPPVSGVGVAKVIV